MSLTGKKVSDSYKDLLQMDNSNAGVDGTLRSVEDGEGTVSALQISTDAVQVDNLKLDGNTITSENTNGNIVLTPNGSGNVQTGNYTFDADQSVGAGQDNFVMTYDNSSGLVSLEAATGGGSMEFISSATASNSATIEFTGLSSTYELYIVTINGLVPASDGTTLWLRVSDDGGCTYKSGATDYSWTVLGRSGSAGLLNTGDNQDAQIELGGSPIIAGTATGEHFSGKVSIMGHSSASFNFAARMDFIGTSSSSGQGNCGSAGGSYLTAATIDGIQFLMSTGNITSGTFRLYGVATS